MTVEELDLLKLNAYLADKLPALHGVSSAKKFAGGQSNPTFLLEGGGGQCVLRRKPPGKLLKSAHAVEREYRVIAALANSKVPVPQALHLCEDESVIGSAFYLMSYESGRIFWDPQLPELDNGERSQLYDAMNQALVDLHQVNIEDAGLADFGKPGNYFARQVERWSQQYRASETESIAAMNTLLDWLPANLPEDDGRQCLIHGDFRLDNMVFTREGIEVKAILDWELSTLGHPFADLAYQCMQWRLPANVPGAIHGLGGVDRRALGIPTEEEYLQLYCQRMGINSIPHWNFYLVFCFFRLAAIVQGVMKRALSGNASNQRALETGKLVKPIAEFALPLI